MATPQAPRSLFAGFEFGAPSSDTDLERAEKALGENLPLPLRELYRAFNGMLRLPNRTPYLWPLFAPKPGDEGLVETNQLLRQNNSLPQDLAAKCLFFGDPGYGPEYAWGFKRDLPGEVILSHPDDGFCIVGSSPLDVWSDEIRQQEQMRRAREVRARQYQYVRHRFTDRDMLIDLKPNDAGFYASCPYHGDPFDEMKFRVIRRGWDHEHCFVCKAKVLQGDEWWAAEPPHEVGLCLVCYARLFEVGL